ncbi:MAG: ROK family protein [Candidatus Hydrogenedentales bacterium]
MLLGIDLGGTFIKTALVTADGDILARTSAPTPAQEGPAAVMDAMAAAAKALIAQHRVDANIVAAGVGAPGPLNWQQGIIFEPPNLVGWRDVPLAAEMEKRLKVRVYLENDANAACYGEHWLGAGRGAKTMCVLTLGTGLGGGIVVHNRLLRGIDGTAGEIGHMTVERDGRQCGCGARGCLETYGSVTGMVRTAREGLECGRASVLQNTAPDLITGELISDLAADGDAFCQWVVTETAQWLGLGIANLINLLNPEKVVLCGGMIAAGDRLFAPLRATAKANAFDVPAERCEIVPAGLGGDSGVLGVAGCAWERLQGRHE